ncbi:MAG: T9SS type A sorting domain-containing protein [Putridiphycobacter sp.]|nr:T9SS type A sorting domain-containing protein [Putridiphycobacter sp.]
MNLLKVILISLVVSFNSFSAMSLTCTSTSNGNWHSNGTWDCVTYPSSTNCPDTIIIDEDVYLSSNINLSSCPPIVLIVNGDLTFKSGRKMYLPYNSKIIVNNGGNIIPEGNGGNSNLIDIGGVTVWNAGAGTIVGSVTPTVIGGSTLPINLVSFYAHILTDQIALHWETLSEWNNNYFDVEFSTDGINYRNIERTKGAGNSVILMHYSAIVNNYKIGVNYYRLKQTDFDGNFSYTQPISVIIPDSFRRTVYPNPNNGQFIIDADYLSTVTIMTLTGLEILHIENYNGEFINLTHLPAGVYLITYFFKEVLYTERFVVQ